MTAEEPFLGVSNSVRGRVWRARPVEERIALAVSQRLGIPEIIGRVLAGRGVGHDDAESYLNPNLKSDLPDPCLLADMDKAACRTADAIRRREKVAVFGDYDVD